MSRPGAMLAAYFCFTAAFCTNHTRYWRAISWKSINQYFAKNRAIRIYVSHFDDRSIGPYRTSAKVLALCFSWP